MTVVLNQNGKLVDATFSGEDVCMVTDLSTGKWSAMATMQTAGFEKTGNTSGTFGDPSTPQTAKAVKKFLEEVVGLQKVQIG